ncbi:hypothetical protein GCM10028813_01430 [Ramlibacter alkalitolerans]
MVVAASASGTWAWFPSDKLLEIQTDYYRCGLAELKRMGPVTGNPMQHAGMAIDNKCEVYRKALYGQYVSEGGTPAAADVYAVSARISFLTQFLASQPK